MSGAGGISPLHSRCGSFSQSCSPVMSLKRRVEGGGGGGGDVRAYLLLKLLIENKKSPTHLIPVHLIPTHLTALNRGTMHFRGLLVFTIQIRTS
jgi:hypothetical protein